METQDTIRLVIQIVVVGVVIVLFVASLLTMYIFVKRAEKPRAASTISILYSVVFVSLFALTMTALAKLP